MARAGACRSVIRPKAAITAARSKRGRNREGAALAARHDDDAFWVVSGDVFLPGFAFSAVDAERFGASRELARLWLVPNAPHHPQGDFGIDAASGLATAPAPRRTWASVGLFRAELFADIAPARDCPCVRDSKPHWPPAARRRGWDGGWTDVGTPSAGGR
jgi:MurNAc alpha-1-phosphate uridylyltransferase